MPQLGDCTVLKRLDAITLANEEDALLPGSPIKAHPSNRDRKRARHKGSRDGKHGRGVSSGASVASGTSHGGRRRERTPRAPSRRSTRETAGKAPPNEYPSERDAPQHERDDSKDAAAARAREPWYARPRVLGEIIPTHTVDRVRGYLDRMAEKDDFLYVSAAGLHCFGVPCHALRVYVVMRGVCVGTCA